MPLPKGKKRLTKAELFDELRHGKTFKATAAKHGKAAAEKQMQAIALSYMRKHGEKKPIKGEAKKLHASHKKSATRKRKKDSKR
jgi:hypothetical protein